MLNILVRMIFCYTILKLRVLTININYLPILPMNKPILERMIFCYTVLKLRVLTIYPLHNYKIKNINYLFILPVNKPVLFLFYRDKWASWATKFNSCLMLFSSWVKECPLINFLIMSIFFAKQYKIKPILYYEKKISRPV